MEFIKFGFKTELLPGETSPFISSSKDVNTQNPNPYGGSYFDALDEIATTREMSRISSIPSPYARMHVTANAFRELVAGKGRTSRDIVNKKNISPDYQCAMSHCLDIFEMIFNFSSLDLYDKGISVRRLSLVDRRQITAAVSGLGREQAENMKSYIDTLSGFREEYKRVIKEAKVPLFQFDFTTLYLFEYENKVFAATSPFTGFFTTSDCDLAKAGLYVMNDDDDPCQLLSRHERTWRTLAERKKEFIEFMYLLLKPNPNDLGKVFPELYDAVKFCLKPDEINNLDTKNIQEVYPQFNFGGTLLPPIKDSNVFLRPDGLEYSFLKYLLYLDRPVDLTIPQEAYSRAISERFFPDDDTTRPVPWVGVNDLLADALFVLPYDISDDYLAIPYTDEFNKVHRRCLLPIKQEAMNYFSIDNLKRDMKIRKYPRVEDVDHFTVTLDVHLENGGTIQLRRDYKSKAVTYPEGVLIQGTEKMENFAFGIYPFVKSDKYENIYSVLFYNCFDTDFKLDFYRMDGNKPVLFPTNKVKKNQTNNVEDVAIPYNCVYYNVSDMSPNRQTMYWIDFVELGLTVDLYGTQTVVTSLIVPQLHDVSNPIPGDTIISIDLGTSNTVVAYMHESVSGNTTEIEEINTFHDSRWNELTFMNKECTVQDWAAASEKNRSDLYLQSPGSDTYSDEMLPNQLCEFIPSKILPMEANGRKGYSFPIPSVMNILRRDTKNVKVDTANLDVTPLVYSAIPFAYYEMGYRDTGSVKYDSIVTDNLKWFMQSDRKTGMVLTDNKLQNAFNAFQSELLYIIRCHMLASRYELDKCKIIWTYPLSFNTDLRNAHEREWSNGYIKYFNPNETRQNLQFNHKVISANESYSPVFYCVINQNEHAHLTLLMDIGGGSTDIIGYQNQAPVFMSSFAFAGNSLFLDGSLNNVQNQMNVVRELVKNLCADLFSTPNTGKTRRISPDTESISAVMNYGLSNHPDEFSRVLIQPHMKFLQMFHNQALLFHTAQLCKLSSKNEEAENPILPYAIYMTGNGSKLLNTDKAQEIFRKVFGISSSVQPDHLQFRSVQYPKLATSHGALKGYDTLLNASNTGSHRTVLFGDAETKNVVQTGSSWFINDPNERVRLKEAVKKNVLSFVDLFFELNGNNLIIKKDEVVNWVNFVDPAIIVKEEISDTLFFQYIARVMEMMSEKLIHIINPNR